MNRDKIITLVTKAHHNDLSTQDIIDLIVCYCTEEHGKPLDLSVKFANIAISSLPSGMLREIVQVAIDYYIKQFHVNILFSKEYNRVILIF